MKSTVVIPCDSKYCNFNKYFIVKTNCNCNTVDSQLFTSKIFAV